MGDSGRLSNMTNLALKFRIFRTMLDLQGRGESVDWVMVTALGRERGQLEGMDYSTFLTEMN
jgi:hypothetical protein